MPTNLYEPNDNFDLETSNVLLALIVDSTKQKLLDNSLGHCTAMQGVSLCGVGMSDASIAESSGLL